MTKEKKRRNNEKGKIPTHNHLNPLTPFTLTQNKFNDFYIIEYIRI